MLQAPACELWVTAPPVDEDELVLDSLDDELDSVELGVSELVELDPLLEPPSVLEVLLAVLLATGGALSWQPVRPSVATATTAAARVR